MNVPNGAANFVGFLKLILEQYQKLMAVINQLNLQSLRLVDEQAELLLLQQELINLLTEYR